MKVPQQRAAAKEFASFWKGKGYEKGDSQSFWMSLLRNVFAVEKPEEFIVFEEQVMLGHTSFIDASIPATRVLIEQKSFDKDLRKGIKQSDGTFLTPFQQAKRYAAELPYSSRPRWIVTCNFAEFLVYDMERPNDEPESILLENLEKEFYRLNFLVDSGDENIRREMEISIKAGELVGELYDRILAQYIDPKSPQTLKNLNALCVRLVFCLYAEDAGIFGHLKFHHYIKSFAAKDVRRALIDLFKVLDTKPENRDPYLDPALAAFPYVNGGLFAEESIEIPLFTDEIVNLLLHDASEEFDWSSISPTIFGAVFESTLNPETRRSGGMHYTSIENIHKLIDPLFMDALNEEFDAIKADPIERARNRKFAAFQTKIASLKFLDPACGSGNFLTETYLSLRRLENKILRERSQQIEMDFTGDIIKVSIQQFYGIEINDFAVTVAKTALWIAESQMMKETEDVVHRDLDFLPLKSYTNIVESNALRVSWREDTPVFQNLNKEDKSVLPPYDYIMGNPPFIGARLMNAEQKADIIAVFGKDWKNIGNLDYVACWYFKAAQLMAGTKTRCAFVSTNSITQGEQVAAIWKPLFERFNIRINFAHRTFRWDSEASLKAHVHCVIVGFLWREDTPVFPILNKEDKSVLPPQIYTNGRAKAAKNINAYLIDADNVFVESRSKPLCDVPEMIFGNMANDEGNLIIEENEYNEFIQKEPDSKKYIRLFLGAQEFLNKKKRYCLWLVDVNPSELRSMRYVVERVEKVRELRSNSKRSGTRKLANTPSLFGEIRQPKEGNYLLVPRVSSENRKYVPLGFVPAEIIASDAVQIIPNASLYHFGILTSSVHMAWMRAVCGRLEMRYRYSKDIVYNNFPWPNVEGGHSCLPNPVEGRHSCLPDFKQGGQECPPSTADACPSSINSSKFLDRNTELEKAEAGNLPHWHQDGKLQFVTFRLADSLPQEKLDELKARKDAFYHLHPQPWDDETAETYFNTIGKLADGWLDAGHGSCVLAFPIIRKIVEDTLMHFDGERYRIHSFVIMPNHVHILVELLEEYKLPEILKSWKGVSANRINKILGGNGTLWQAESFDRVVRSEIHYQHVLEYILKNPQGFPADKFSLMEGRIVEGGHSCPPYLNSGRQECLSSTRLGGQECPPSTIEKTAQGILDARALYPDCSLADLYDETTMPPELRKAHQANDRAVMEAYGFSPDLSESEIVAELMKLYKNLTEK